MISFYFAFTFRIDGEFLGTVVSYNKSNYSFGSIVHTVRDLAHDIFLVFRT